MREHAIVFEVDEGAVAACRRCGGTHRFLTRGCLPIDFGTVSFHERESIAKDFGIPGRFRFAVERPFVSVPWGPIRTEWH